jgi:hypothetical protein
VKRGGLKRERATSGSPNPRIVKKEMSILYAFISPQSAFHFKKKRWRLAKGKGTTTTHEQNVHHSKKASNRMRKITLHNIMKIRPKRAMKDIRNALHEFSKHIS